MRYRKLITKMDRGYVGCIYYPGNATKCKVSAAESKLKELEDAI